MLRFPRRYPLTLLVLLIPLSIFLYNNFGGQVVAWASNRIVPISPAFGSPPPLSSNISHSVQDAVPHILLVSAFFPLSKSKHSMAQYSDWLSRFLGRITTPVYFYAPPDLEPTIRAIRGSLPIVIDTRYETAFDIPPLQGRKETYEKMHSWDREKDHHSPELYAVWAAKPFLLAEALRRLNAGEGLESLGMTSADDIQYAFWNDAGSFRRKHVYSSWPDLARLDEVWKDGEVLSGTKKDELVFFPVQRLPDYTMQLWMEHLGPVDNDVSEGSFFGGHPKVADWWEKYYYAYHDHYLAQHVFVGKDQTLINALFLLRPSHFISVWHGDPDAPAALFRPATFSSLDTEFVLGDCGDQWYYYQFFLASDEERDKMREVWNRTWYWDFWKKEWWTRRRESCRLTRTVDMLTSLRRMFGDGWNPPPSSVQF
ncbi:uncharacterized protein FOMMEDRAFT_22912 [Fomitiporia mediterranea MF3/22]|uniref:uncharacterized protein n=1 Tax=Fomitiporia mediterranea (strain MF3/22) TaxID=694068 RepID=UPI0004409402|nr:uncharacterized protein FOMMEDRAFT_22912 [Fomitiporia mediterranea MF3/22]EJC99896.1 hypothetical protein FOMMEDRAFT_22912 [Fomitiporia mediterranea MF3/22]